MGKIADPAFLAKMVLPGMLNFSPFRARSVGQLH